MSANEGSLYGKGSFLPLARIPGFLDLSLPFPLEGFPILNPSRIYSASDMVGFAYAKPTMSFKECASAISFYLFLPVDWLSAFELCLYPFSRLCLPWCTSFLFKIDRLSVKALNCFDSGTAYFRDPLDQRFSLS